MITPHNDKLVNLVVPKDQKEQVLESCKNFKRLVLDGEKVQEVKNIANGAYSPLEGFLGKEDFEGVVSSMSLGNGSIWAIPIVLDINEKDFIALKDEQAIVLSNQAGKPIALLKNLEFYPNNKDFFAQNVYGTKDQNHPGVAAVYKMGKYLLGGRIQLLDKEKNIFPEYNLTPLQAKRIFKSRGWKTIVAFQTRNVPHLGHEFLQKHALQTTDGLFIQPIIGEKKTDDFKDEFILSAYEVLIDRYHNRNKVLLGILPLKMRYAGPREAIFHAQVRKNFGCTHFIVGRDHAGVGKYYSPYAAQEIFNNFNKEEIGIEILKYPETIYCKVCRQHIFTGFCPHKGNEQIYFSGTKIRESIKKKESPPFNIIIRPEVYHLLTNSSNPLVDYMYKDEKTQKGFTLWFTGLSQSGKTTVANKVFEALRGMNIKVERLDGDIVRQSLSKDLGFSKEDREENIRRVRYLSKLFNQKGVAVIASFISPYKRIRNELRDQIPNFIEVFANAPLKVCEARDTKGLYAKARKGEIQNFTGISDPYEAPENPEVMLYTDKETIDQCAQKVVNFLEKKNYIKII
jgi:sulfate adenylyltransferase